MQVTRWVMVAPPEVERRPLTKSAHFATGTAKAWSAFLRAKPERERKSCASAKAAVTTSAE